MRLGIFAKIFVRPTLAETLDAILAQGLDCVQFNFACVGLPTLPEKLSASVAGELHREIRKRKMQIAAISGTFNLIDMDLARRRENLQRLEHLAVACRMFGAPMITLCTGTRDEKDMWKGHPENNSPEAWRDLLESMAIAVQIADKHNICLGIEPETANVVNSARKARRLLDEMKSPRLKIVMDASNLFHPGDAARTGDILNEAFDLLGRDIALAHAKDFRDTGKMEYAAPGKGQLPWAHYLELLRQTGFDGPLIMHSLGESEVAESVNFLRGKMDSFTFEREGIRFHFKDKGAGVPFFYQHGLGGDTTQPLGLFNPPPGIRLISFDCRGHGQTIPSGPAEKLGFDSFANDLLALMDELNIKRAVVGGISMGAGVALNFALRYPERVMGLVLQRPAWLDRGRNENMEMYFTMARLIREEGPEKGLEKEMEMFQKILRESPSGAKSLISHFLHPRAMDMALLLERIPLDAPNRDRAEWRQIKAPTLVLANRADPVHPFEFGETLAREIPGAEFKELTPKSVSVEEHHTQAQRFLEEFLVKHFKIC